MGELVRIERYRASLREESRYLRLAARHAAEKPDEERTPWIRALQENR